MLGLDRAQGAAGLAADGTVDDEAGAVVQWAVLLSLGAVGGEGVWESRSWARRVNLRGVVDSGYRESVLAGLSLKNSE